MTTEITTENKEQGFTINFMETNYYTKVGAPLEFLQTVKYLCVYYSYGYDVESVNFMIPPIPIRMTYSEDVLDDFQFTYDSLVDVPTTQEFLDNLTEAFLYYMPSARPLNTYKTIRLKSDSAFERIAEYKTAKNYLSSLDFIKL